MFPSNDRIPQASNPLPKPSNEHRVWHPSQCSVTVFTSRMHLTVPVAAVCSAYMEILGKEPHPKEERKVLILALPSVA